MQIFKLIPIFLFFFTACQQNNSQVEQETTAGKAETVAQNIDTLPSPSFPVSYITGNFDPAKHEDFVRIEDKHTDKNDIYLRQDAYKAFKEMYEAAAKDGVKLLIRSATRNFNAQKGIWEAKWTGRRILSDGKNAAKDYPFAKGRALKILEYSSMPGTSRHHWGTDIDLNAFNNKYFESGEGLKVYNWLTQHAASYGFCQPYTAKDDQRPNGYNEEKWHWSYLPIAQQLSDQAAKILSNEMIKGFKGSEAASEINVVHNYILGINQDCL